jgi:hypothetical protein
VLVVQLLDLASEPFQQLSASNGCVHVGQVQLIIAMCMRKLLRQQSLLTSTHPADQQGIRHWQELHRDTNQSKELCATQTHCSVRSIIILAG